MQIISIAKKQNIAMQMIATINRVYGSLAVLHHPNGISIPARE